MDSSSSVATGSFSTRELCGALTTFPNVPPVRLLFWRQSTSTSSCARSVYILLSVFSLVKTIANIHLVPIIRPEGLPSFLMAVRPVLVLAVRRSRHLENPRMNDWWR